MLPVERLAVWDRALALTVGVARLSRTLRTRDGRELGSQAWRTAISIAANIADGSGSDTERQFARYLGIARASAYELDAILRVGVAADVVDAEAAGPLIGQCADLKRMLRALAARVAHPRAIGARGGTAGRGQVTQAVEPG